MLQNDVRHDTINGMTNDYDYITTKSFIFHKIIETAWLNVICYDIQNRVLVTITIR